VRDFWEVKRVARRSLGRVGTRQARSLDVYDCGLFAAIHGRRSTVSATCPCDSGIRHSLVCSPRDDYLWDLRSLSQRAQRCASVADDGFERKLLGQLMLCARMAAGGEAVSCEGLRAIDSNASWADSTGPLNIKPVSQLSDVVPAVQSGTESSLR
jgi:hypothetical protein